ncbi:DUF2971 domain-containing protein [Neptuniibacter halophilus]|uniref:DUF2971 domain-containing protein n=1 Tax=Neptuniibacter halophilus TaxID=651666 RepID=UPI0025730DA1|nr:DUF2971 domain-containing protein [Neptuniibacter halophilus]
MNYLHYTDVNALHSIISKQKIWLTDIRFLNDSQELIKGFEIFEEILKAPITTPLLAHQDHIDISKDYILTLIQEHQLFGSSEDPIFVFSLSQEHDLLSQWRAYGDYAIEFDEEMLSEEFKTLSTCIYEPLAQKQAAVTAITEAIETVSNDFEISRGYTQEQTDSFLCSLLARAALFKHDGFQEEKEARIIIDSFSEAKKIHYRARGNMLIPYIELDISLESIKRIHIGPIANQDLAARSISEFVQRTIDQHNSDYGFTETDIAVVKSPIPFRS